MPKKKRHPSVFANDSGPMTPAGELGLMESMSDLKAFAECLQSPIIRIQTAGGEYHVHQDLLIKHSKFFEGMARSHFLKPGTPIVLNCAPQCSFVDAFACLFKFMYTGRWPEFMFPDKQAYCIYAAHVYTLADYLVVDNLKELALTEFQRGLTPKTTRYIDPRYFGDAVEPTENTDLALEPNVVVMLHDILYDNPFDYTFAELQPMARGGGMNKQQPETGCPLQDDVERREPTDPSVPVEASKFPLVNENAEMQNIDDPQGSFVDGRDAARKVLSAYASKNMTRLLESKQTRLLFADGGEFVLDVLSSI